MTHKSTGTFWVAADIPDFDHHDVRALKHERDFAGTPVLADAASLYKALPVTLPGERPGFLRACTKDDMYSPELSPNGHFRIMDDEALEAIPRFAWDDIFGFVGAELPPKPEKSKKKRR